MIAFSLICEREHTFDAWFKTGATYEDQRSAGIVTCPVCGSSTVDKALMAPAVARSGSGKMSVASGTPTHAQIIEALRQMRKKVVSEADYVGDKFANEARKIHFDEAPARGIYGEATRDEVSELLDDGVEIMALPNLPEEHN